MSNIYLPVAKLVLLHYCFGDLEGEGTLDYLFFSKLYAADARGKNKSWDVGDDKTGASTTKTMLLTYHPEREAPVLKCAMEHALVGRQKRRIQSYSFS